MHTRQMKEQTEPCIHFWDIEEVNGPISQGVCRKCGAIREFRNWLSKTELKKTPGCSHKKNPNDPLL